MENITAENLIAIIGTVSAAITAIMMAIGKHVMPTVMEMFGYKDQEKKNTEKIFKLETNHLVHIQDDINEIKSDVHEIKKNLNIIDNRVVRLETKLEKK